ncbi:MAG: putative protein YnbD [Stenotrophomonas maltophilia]|nr:MAG: putative protein YnbD [Stenotrophomonas maltophilia]
MAPRDPGVLRRAVLWLVCLAPFFFLSYGLANGYASGLPSVGSVVFDWERLVPLWPWTIVPYWSIDLLYGLSFLLPRTRHELDRHALRLLTAQLLAVSCFVLFPLRFSVERPALDGVFGHLFDLLMGFDKPFNQAPSLHIALLVVLWVRYGCHARGPWRVLLHGWFALIGLSVLTTWQHHFFDLPTGALAGWLCVWLWPMTQRSPLALWRLTRDGQRLRLALRYAVGALVCLALAIWGGGWALWLCWPALALLLVALNYLALGAEGFQKGADGRQSLAVQWLLAPYRLGARLNAWLWTRRAPQAERIVDDLWLGPLAAAGAAGAPFTALLDATAELQGPSAGRAYACLPLLDLVAPSVEQCRAGAALIERLLPQGPLLVACALGYSRSATLVAGWLLLSGRARDVDAALALLRRQRPRVVLGPAHRAVLEALCAAPGAAPTDGALLHV